MPGALAADQPPRSTSPPAPLGRSVQDHLGQHLRTTYEALQTSPVPKDLRSILARFERVLSSDAETVDPAFRDGLSAALPSLRAFALYLTRHNERADDLVQDTMMKAWDKRAGFRPGTNLNAWLFTILRNSYCSEQRRRFRELQDTDGEYAASLITPPDQIDCLQLEDLQAAVGRLSKDQREALLLVGLEGLAYEEVAAICRCPVGTIKSRVNRARIRLAQLMGLEDGDWASDKLPCAARHGGRIP